MGNGPRITATKSASDEFNHWGETETEAETFIKSKQNNAAKKKLGRELNRTRKK